MCLINMENRKTLIIFLVSFLLSFISFYNLNYSYAKNNSSAGDRKVEQKTRPIPTIIPSVTPTPTTFYRAPGSGEWIGKVSHYSYDGCVGCNPARRMANGEVLDDGRATLAFNWLPMNTRVLVTNLDNGKSIEAIVTDTGGFNELNRIADLTPVVANFLGTKTDVTNVKIEVLN